jgi:hypothetical protein
MPYTAAGYCLNRTAFNFRLYVTGGHFALLMLICLQRGELFL